MPKCIQGHNIINKRNCILEEKGPLYWHGWSISFFSLNNKTRRYFLIIKNHSSIFLLYKECLYFLSFK